MSAFLTPAGANWQREANRLSAAGVAMPKSPTLARMEAKRTADSVSRGSAIDILNRQRTSEMNRRRLASTRGATMGMTRTGSDLQMALPKVRQPLGSLVDKGVPFNIQNPRELMELRRWCRLWYSTHDLVPLLIDIYSKFPLTGLELKCKDPKIEEFYNEMFLNQLNYEEFLPDVVGREYFIAGEVTTLGHFDESLGIWSSEEVLNPDMIEVSKSMFVEEERVQLLVKDLVESLRSGPQGMGMDDERPSERLERNHEYQMLVENYPEMIQAASRDDGLDIADSLITRMVNRVSPWDRRGTPFLLRSFRTLLMEEELNAAEDAVASRLYSPMILATMGIENMGGEDQEPWIPSQSELDDLRDDMQSALAADFKLLVHNFGVDIKPVFGRESVPDFSNDYDRIDAKLMQAWGIGEALIMGGTGAGGAYASSALNREVCEQLMLGLQKKVIRNMRKRMEIVAEAQEHYDYELKGGQRVPLYREIVKEDPDTGERQIVRVPKLLIPEVHFATLNLRDETQERQFIMDLKSAGVPVSDKMLAVNIQMDFEQELEREAKETVDKAMAKAQAWKSVQNQCDVESLPYPEELVQHLQATLMLRQALAQTEMAEDQTKMMEQQADQMSPAGQVGALPGTMPMDPTMMGMGGAPPDDAPPEDDGGMGMMPPMSSGPSGSMDEMGMDGGGGVEPARNFGGGARPAESDEMRANSPRAASTPARRYARRLHVVGSDEELLSPMGPRVPSKLELSPSSLGSSQQADERRVEAAIKRRELFARYKGRPTVSQLVNDRDFYRMCNATGDEAQIKGDWPDIQDGKKTPSESILRDLVDQYEEITGTRPIWDS